MDPEKTLTFCHGLRAEEVTHCTAFLSCTCCQQLGSSYSAEQHASLGLCCCYWPGLNLFYVPFCLLISSSFDAFLKTTVDAFLTTAAICISEVRQLCGFYLMIFLCPCKGVQDAVVHAKKKKHCRF